jgi:hypothetical protein
MTDRQQVKNASGTVEIIDDAVIAHAYAIRIHSLHSMVRETVQRHAQTINAGFDSGLDGRWKIEEVSVEIP